MKKIIYITILSRVAFLVIGVIAFLNLSFQTQNYLGNFHYPTIENSTILPFKTWDAQHYLFLADKGYLLGQESNRFFPLYPALIFGLTIFLKNSLVVSYALSLLFCIGCVATIYKLSEKLFPKKNIGFLSTLFLLSFPTAFYLSLPYTESLFLFLCLQFFYRMETKKMRTALLCLLLIPLTRPTGIFILLPCLYYVLHSPSIVVVSIPTFNKPIKIPFAKNLMLLIVPLVGILIYFLMHQILLHNPLAGITGISSVASWNPINILDPGSLLRNLLSYELQLHGFQTSFLDRAFFVLFLCMLPLIFKKLPRQYFYFSLVMGLVPLLGSFTSYMRYVLPVFPLFIVLALLLKDRKMILPRIFLLLIFISLQICFFVMHILNYWVS